MSVQEADARVVVISNSKEGSIRFFCAGERLSVSEV